ncbi:Adenylosuccinate lyase [Gracilariopsis chorda]|uniref:Adenylosuccinate lyase n=1 Tax=Gracilariopsis chorda TaxID=448386 RepID=A0A2V3J479_9FLOR|nr:Adenylosuccinate lyase [Gracilariopsis chorda]|eukprot:PXF48797.1 Adenylosuccinate lyase [Gracilariopsis chorda]
MTATDASKTADNVDVSSPSSAQQPALNYVSPLSTRYASAPMRENFSDVARFRLWRKLWAALAWAEHQLGLQVTQEQVHALENAPDVDMQLAKRYEAKLRHDVMAHVHALGDQVPLARPVIHLGATSCFVTDNSEVMQACHALDLLIPAVWRCVSNLAHFAQRYRDLPTLAFTHLQPAQPTTVGKRAALWLQDFLFDAHNLEHVRRTVRLRGVKGTTGTQASFLGLFDGDHEKVKKLEALVAQRMGFEQTWPITGQTYSRKQDFFVLSALAGVGQSAAKMANDIRLLQHMKEVEEPFAKHQIGSSAMPYKRNPMRCERINALARFLQSLVLNPAETASTQWLERTLDDSANRRLSVSEAFLTCDAILQLVLNVSSALVVYPKIIDKHLLQELPFIATESILMAAVQAGGDRQQLHEAIRVHAMRAGARVKEEGAPNDLLQRIAQDELFSSVRDRLEELCEPALFVGRAPQQVDDFLGEHVRPALQERERILQGDFSGDVRI